MTWLVLKMDEGVVGAFPTRKAALAEFQWGPVRQRYTYGPGAYEYITGYSEDDGDDFFVETLATARHQWEDAVEAWEQAGCPMGRISSLTTEEQEDSQPTH